MSSKPTPQRVLDPETRGRLIIAGVLIVCGLLGLAVASAGHEKIRGSIDAAEPAGLLP